MKNIFKLLFLLTLTLTFKTHSAKSSEFGIKVKMPEGSTEFKIKNAFKDGINSAFSSAPELFNLRDDEYILSSLMIESGTKIEVSITLKSSKKEFSERITGESFEAFLLGKNLAVRLAEKLCTSEQINFSKEIKIKMAGGSISNSAKTQVIVFDTMGTGYNSDQLNMITESVRAKIAEIKAIEVKESDLIKAEMAPDKDQKKCLDLSCQIEIAGAMGVEEGIILKVSSAGKLTSITIKRISTERNSILSSKYVRLKEANFEQIVEKAEELSMALYKSSENNVKMNSKTSATKESQSKKEITKSLIKPLKSTKVPHKDSKYSIIVNTLGLLQFGPVISLEVGQHSATRFFVRPLNFGLLANLLFAPDSEYETLNPSFGIGIGRRWFSDKSSARRGYFTGIDAEYLRIDYTEIGQKDQVTNVFVLGLNSGYRWVFDDFLSSFGVWLGYGMPLSSERTYLSGSKTGQVEKLDESSRVYGGILVDLGWMM